MGGIRTGGVARRGRGGGGEGCRLPVVSDAPNTHPDPSQHTQVPLNRSRSLSTDPDPSRQNDGFLSYQGPNAGSHGVVTSLAWRFMRGTISQNISYHMCPGPFFLIGMEQHHMLTHVAIWRWACVRNAPGWGREGFVGGIRRGRLDGEVGFGVGIWRGDSEGQVGWGGGIRRGGAERQVGFGGGMRGGWGRTELD